MRLEHVLSAVVVIAIFGCGDNDVESTTTVQQMVYVDLRTRDAVVIEQTDTVPAVHPGTGERSLMPGLYCSGCETWHPAPPLEELQRTPAAQRCPQCRAVMSGDGPWPDGVALSD